MAYAATPLSLDAHRDALSRLWAENMSDERIASVIPGRMRWLYEQGPEGATTTVLGVHAESGALVGCGSFFHRPTWVDGRRVRAGVLCDFAVTRAHRIAGAAIAIQRALIKAGRDEGLELLYGYPNEQSIAVCKRVGYRVIGQATTWVKPLYSAYKLRDALASPETVEAALPAGLVARHHLVKAAAKVAHALEKPWALRAAAAPVDAGLWVADRVRVAKAVVRARGERLQLPDPRIDELWERSRGGYGVVGEKSSAYLEWRYARFTTAEHHVFGITRRDDRRLAGYVIYTVDDGKAYLRDLFAEDLDATAEALLLALSQELRGRRIDSVSLSYVGSPAFAARLRATGFLLRPAKRPLVVHPDVAESLKSRALDPASWFMLDGELDI
jgi:RimJ/RimL family protein N-acetyltransferase